MQNNTKIALFIATIFIIGALLIVGQKSPGTSGGSATNTNITNENGTQIIQIDARGGYSPQYTVAKANIPTVIRMKTSGTFSCASTLVIPKLNYRANLQPTGTVDIPLGAQKAGSDITGLCAMGMYNFNVNFN